MHLKHLWREPLLHFFLIGFVLFFYYSRVAPPGIESHRIVVTQAQVDDLAQQFSATWLRPPTAAELSNLVDSYVRDEILYREGRELGFDRDDPVIKRRIRQKLDVMSEEALSRTPPTDAELGAYLTANPEKFREPPAFSFNQILLAPAGDDASLRRKSEALREALGRGAAPESLGQKTLLPSHEEHTSFNDVARDFGSEFASQLERLPLDEWVGPVKSGYGAHLVRVSARTAPELPALEAVRPIVVREWEADRRSRATAEEYRRLRDKYTVVVEAKLPAGVAP